MQKDRSPVCIEMYSKYIDDKIIERIQKKAKQLQDLHIVNINSTYYGGGVAVLLTSLTMMMNQLGIKTGWRILQGSPDFFGVTKKMHNAMQGHDIHFTDRKIDIYESVIYENSLRNHLDHNIVIIHDPQPLGMIKHYRKTGPWIWRCHIDLTQPNPKVWNYMKQYIEMYDAVLLSLEDYKQDLNTPQVFFQPAIDPFSIKNKEMTADEIQERLDHYDIPCDLPIVAQISRFDKWKDPEGVIRAFKIARKEVDATLILLGNMATDDPEGKEVYESLLECQEERIIIISVQDTALVNALQRKAAVIIQKSIREGFGLTVTEAMWKGTPVIGGNVGGIKYQIQDGENGFLVQNEKECAERMVTLLRNPAMCDEMGRKAKERVKDNYLLSRYLEQYLDLFSSFKPEFRLVSLDKVPAAWDKNESL